MSRYDDTQRETAEKIERVDSFFLDKGKIKIGEVYTFLRFLSEKNPWKMPLRDDIKRGLVQEFRSAFLCMEKMTAEKKLFINWILEISLSDYQQYKSERLGKIRELLANVSHKGVKKQFSDFIYGQMLQTEVGSAEQKCVMMLANVMKKGLEGNMHTQDELLLFAEASEVFWPAFVAYRIQQQTTIVSPACRRSEVGERGSHKQQWGVLDYINPISWIRYWLS